MFIISQCSQPKLIADPHQFDPRIFLTSFWNLYASTWARVEKYVCPHGIIKTLLKMLSVGCHTNRGDISFIQNPHWPIISVLLLLLPVYVKLYSAVNSAQNAIQFGPPKKTRMHTAAVAKQRSCSLLPFDTQGRTETTIRPWRCRPERGCSILNGPSGIWCPVHSPPLLTRHSAFSADTNASQRRGGKRLACN